MRFSLAGKISFLMAGCVTVAIFFVDTLSQWEVAWPLKYTVTLLILLPIVCWSGFRIAKHITDRLAALENGLKNFKDKDFSMSIYNKHHDELGVIISIYNDVSNALREERQAIYQRELLLDTVIQNANLSLFLIDSKHKIIYANHDARQLIHQGKPIQGLSLFDFSNTAPEPLQGLLEKGGDGLFSIEQNNEHHTYHLSKSQFTLNTQVHYLYLVKQLTNTLHQQEIIAWKKIIRLVSHEMNNSLAPISSMAYSGKMIIKGQGDEQLARVFNTIIDRSNHLTTFLNDYIRLAKLPLPNKQLVKWPLFIESLRQYIEFSILSELPHESGYFDTVQMEQVFINLIKNAHESGAQKDEIHVRIQQTHEFSQIEFIDAGRGMSDKELKDALLPFYSTKPTGSGVGLTLSREIVEAHAGKISIANRKAGGLIVSLWVPTKSAALFSVNNPYVEG